jgi:hypothetical protein
LIQNSILDHIHNIYTGTVDAFNVGEVVSILTFTFISLCLMVDFVIWSVFATFVGSSSLFYHILQLSSWWSQQKTVQHIGFAVVGRWQHCHGVIQWEISVTWSAGVLCICKTGPLPSNSMTIGCVFGMTHWPWRWWQQCMPKCWNSINKLCN